MRTQGHLQEKLPMIHQMTSRYNQYQLIQQTIEGQILRTQKARENLFYFVFFAQYLPANRPAVMNLGTAGLFNCQAGRETRPRPR
jgi:hypothetical protein